MGDNSAASAPTLCTTVSGKPDECIALSEALKRLTAAIDGDGGGDAIGGIRKTRELAASGWHGPAHDAFADTVDGCQRQLAGLANTAHDLESAVRDFADSLSVVRREMDEAHRVAVEGQLNVHDSGHPDSVSPPPNDCLSNPSDRLHAPVAQGGCRSYIFPPDPPVRTVFPSSLGPGGLSDPMADAKIANIEAAAREYDIAVAEYNNKVAVYNRCKGIVEQARKVERETHAKLQETIGEITTAVDYLVHEVGFYLFRTTVAAAASEEKYRTAKAAAQRSMNRATWLREFATTNASQEALHALNMQAAKEENAAVMHQKVAARFDSYMKLFPQPARDGVVHYFGRPRYFDVPKHSAASPRFPKFGSTALSGLGASTFGITAGLEAYDAARGKQSWTKAGVDSTVVTASGLTGSYYATAGATAVTAGAATATGWLAGMESGAATGALMGSWGGPVVIIGAGIVGGMVGAMAGQHVADTIAPE